MKTLTQKGLERRMKNWVAHREEVLDFYLRTADEPSKRMIRRTLRRGSQARYSRIEYGTAAPRTCFHEEHPCAQSRNCWGITPWS